MGTPTRLSVAAIAATLAACATAYKPESTWNQGGYSEQRRAPGEFEVWFLGNDYTTEDRNEELAMLRAAELCLGERKTFMRTSDYLTTASLSGYRPGYSIMVTRQVLPPTGTGNTPSPVPTTVGYTPGRELYTKQSGLRVECLAESGEDAREAAVVAASIRERYKIAPKLWSVPPPE